MIVSIFHSRRPEQKRQSINMDQGYFYGCANNGVSSPAGDPTEE